MRCSVFSLVRIASVCLAILALLWAMPARAATFNVTSEADLVAAINTANATPGPDTIVFNGNIELSTAVDPDTSLPLITSEITIDGNGFTLGPWPGAGIFDKRFLRVPAGGNLTVNNLAVGNAISQSSGGAILADGGTLTITNSRFQSNFSSAGGVGNGGGAIAFSGAMTLTISGSTFDNNRTEGVLGGGAVLAEGNVVIRNSTFSYNQANFIGNGGGAVSAASANLTIEGSTFNGNNANRMGGALLADASVATITNSTFSGNSSQLGGGAIHLASGTIDMVNSTMAGNSSPISGGGLSRSGGTFSVRNSIISGNFAPANPNCSAGINGSDNGSDTGECPGVTRTVDVGTDISWAFANNGHPVQTIALLPGSRAIDAGGAGCPLLDQRATTRSSPCDLGAYELGGPASVTSVGVPANGTYGTGQVLSFTVNWDNPMNVTGSPQLSVVIGATTRQATYVSGHGTNALVFQYTVVLGEFDTDGITVGTLALNGGSISTANGAGVLALNAVGSTAAVLVAGLSPPALTAIPTLSEWMLMLLGVLMAASALFEMRRR